MLQSFYGGNTGNAEIPDASHEVSDLRIDFALKEGYIFFALHLTFKAHYGNN